jgi:hypothetical protein
MSLNRCYREVKDVDEATRKPMITPVEALSIKAQPHNGREPLPRERRSSSLCLAWRASSSNDVVTVT